MDYWPLILTFWLLLSFWPAGLLSEREYLGSYRCLRRKGLAIHNICWILLSVGSSILGLLESRSPSSTRSTLSLFPKFAILMAWPKPDHSSIKVLTPIWNKFYSREDEYLGAPLSKRNRQEWKWSRAAWWLMGLKWGCFPWWFISERCRIGCTVLAFLFSWGDDEVHWERIADLADRAVTVRP